MDDQSADIKGKRFLWGLCLAWIPFFFLAIPAAIGIFHAFQGISQEKATGLGAVAGGLAEFFATFGFAATIMFEIVAITMLLRSFSGERPMRSTISAISICCSGFMLAIVGVFVWLTYFLRPQ
ncbi:MAG: hypothetical protein HYR57_08505 [Candidatus Koribacter versatilis]|nr:hypothetical protein [Candidatus Koribacter versatilis]